MQQRKGLPGTRENALAELYQVSVCKDAEDILVEVVLAAHERET